MRGKTLLVLAAAFTGLTSVAVRAQSADPALPSWITGGTANAAIETEALKGLVETKSPVSIYLVNGIKLHGVITSYDDKVLVMEKPAGQLVYKHSISIIVPPSPPL